VCDDAFKENYLEGNPPIEIFVNLAGLISQHLVKVYDKVVLYILGVFFFLGPAQKSAAQCGSVDFTASARKGCIPFYVKFNALGTSTAAGTSFKWNLGGGSFNGNDTASKIYFVAGQYKITMEADLSSGGSPCVVTKDTFITVLPTPVPDIILSSGVNVCNRSLPVTLIDTTPGVETHREWIVDGNSFTNTATNKHLSYYFASPGTINVSLNVTNNYGCSGLTSENVNVYDSIPLDMCVNVTVSTTANKPVTARFSAAVPNTFPRTIVYYNWSFPGGTITTTGGSSITETVASPNPPLTVTYPDLTKKYDVCLTIVMDDGCNYTICRKGFISPFITPTFQTKCAGQQYGVNTDKSDTGRHNYQFNFPQGMVMLPLGDPDPKSLIISYNAAGTYGAVIKYHYKGYGGCQISITYPNYVTVIGPKANFSSLDNQVCGIGDTVHLTNTTDTTGAGRVKYTWYFYDSVGKKLLPTNNKLGPAFNRDTFYVVKQTGKISVGLVASSTNGCTDSVVQNAFISVNSPKANFVVNQPIGCSGSQIVLTAKTNPPEGLIVKYKYNWTMQSESNAGDHGSGSSLITPYTPSGLGKYDVSLTVSNGHCSSDTTKYAVFQIIGDKTNITAKDHSGCANPDFTTTVSLGAEQKYPNDPSNPPTYKWYTDPWNALNCVFQDNTAKSTQVTFGMSGCYNIYCDVTTSLGTDTCKQTYALKENTAICIGAGLSFTIHPRKCLGDTIPVDNYSDPAATNFKWTISPPSLAKIIPTDTSKNISVIYYADTCYTLQLNGQKLVSGQPCLDSSIDNSVCLVATKADFTTSTPTFHCAPAIGRFKNASTNATSYIWRFDDGDTLSTTSDSVVHVYRTLKKGEYNISLTAFSANGCSNTIVKNDFIDVVGPVPHFTLDKKVGCDSVTVHFKNTSKNVNKFYFEYGDGAATIVNGVLLPHTYHLQDPNLDSIIINPILLSEDDTTCKVFYEDTIKLYRTPSDVYIKPDTAFGCTPLKVHFTAVSRTANNWRWDLDNDGKVDDSTHKVATFTFKTPGKYVPKLIVRNHKQCPYTVYGDTIYVIPNSVAGFTPSVHKFCGKADIVYKNTTSNYKTFIFDYGDGSPVDHNVIAKHTYFFDPTVDKGDSIQFFPKLISFNAAGCSDTFRDVLTAYAMPVAGFKSSVVSGCSPLKVHFTDTSSFSFGTEWDFDNDGVIDAYGRVADHVFSPGLYTVKMRSISIHGCVDSLVKVNMILVNAPPIANFSVSDSVICFKSAVQLHNETFPDAHVVKWTWKFDDPLAPYTTSAQRDPVFRFYSIGQHYISLTAEDNLGCTGFIKKLAVRVEDTLPPPNVNMAYVTVTDTHSVTIVWNKDHNPLFKSYQLNGLIGGKHAAIYTTTDVNDTSYTETGNHINTSGLTYCYSLQTINNCGHISFATFPSCTILLNETAAAGPINNLVWNTYRGWVPARYLIYRKGDDGKFIKIDSVDGGTQKYSDSLLCDENYCYYVVAVRDTTGGGPMYTSMSNTTCLHAAYVRQTRPVNLRYVTDVRNTNVKLLWDTILYKNLRGYIISKYSTTQGWQYNYAFSALDSFIDGNVDINDQSYDYLVRTTDKCGYDGPTGNLGSSILLSQNIAHDKVNLSWNAYHNWPTGVLGYALQVQLRDKSFKTIKTLTDTFYTDDSVYNTIDTAYCYRVIAYEKGGSGDTSTSNRTCAILPSRVFVPNAFTPNGNHVNDVWQISSVSLYNVIGKNVKTFSARVFNRWGTLVFETDDLHKGWDGTFHGAIAPMDVYIYLIDAESVDGKTIHLKGNVTLLN